MKSTMEITPNLPEQNSPSGRLYFLDNLRSFIILLVVVFHTAFPYSVNFSAGSDWYVVDRQHSLFFDIFIMSAYAFLMPVMFFIAGYFGIQSLARKGQLTFWRDKLLRIVIPWALGVIFLAPVFGYIHSLSRNLHPAYLNYWVSYFFGQEYQKHGQLHFYFLGVLTLYYVVLSIVYQIYKPLGKISHRPIRSFRGFFILFGLATGIIFFCGNLVINEGIFVKIGVFDIPVTRFIPYLCYFFLGVLAYKQQWFTDARLIPKIRGWVLFLILLLTFSKKGLLPDRIEAICYALSYYFFCLTATLALLAFFQKRINFTSKLLSNLSANSFAVYFVHMLIVLPLNLAIQNLQWNVYLKYLLVGILSVTLSYLVSQHALSKIPIFSGKVKRVTSSPLSPHI
jgi:glucans biosynthesis protein C